MWAAVVVIRPPVVGRHGIAPTRGVGAWNPHRFQHALHRIAAGVAVGGAAAAAPDGGQIILVAPVVAGRTYKLPGFALQQTETKKNSKGNQQRRKRVRKM